MLGRRRFLQSTTTLAGLAFGGIAGAQEGSADCKPVSPAIASLKSLKGEAQPITAQERAERQEKARRLMHTNGMDAVLLMPGTSLRYFSGIKWRESEPFNQGNLDRLAGHRAAVPGGAAAALLAVSRSGCTVGGVDCVSPQRLLEAWA